MKNKIKLTPKDIETLDHIAEHYGDVFHEAAHCTYGIGGWFKAFIQSDSFAKMDAEHKASALDIYENLKYILETLEHINHSISIK